MQKPKITIGLIAYNEEENIAQILTNIHRVSHEDNIEVVLVDNCSDDKTLQLAENWRAKNSFFPIKILRRSKNHISEARNDVWMNALGEWIFFIDADCRISNESWNEHVNAIRRYELEDDVGAIGGGNLPAGAESLITTGVQVMSTNWLSHMGSIQLRNVRETKTCTLLSACNLMVKNKALQLCQGFDPNFHPAGEDLALSYRLMRNNFRLIGVKSIEVEHHIKTSWILWLRKMLRYGEAQVQVAFKYPEHFRGIRGLQLIMGVSFLLLIVSFPSIAICFLFFHLLAFIVLCFFQGIHSLKKISVGYILTLLSQSTYLVGEIYGLIKVLKESICIFFRIKRQYAK